MSILYIVIILFILFIACAGKFMLNALSKDDEMSIADKFLDGGLTTILITLPTTSDAVLQFLYDLFKVPKSVTDAGLSPRWLIVIGIVFLFIGSILKIIDLTANYVILNMPGTIHHTKEDGMLKSLKAKHCDEIEASTENCQAAMPKLTQNKANGFLRDIQLQMNKFNDQTKNRRCFTGMAPIPFVIYAGTKHRGRDIKCYLEFDKATQQYLILNNNKKYPKLQKTEIGHVNSNEIVVAVSTTASVVEANIRQFNMPVFNLSLEEPKDNAIFSKKQLDDYVNDTITYISEVCKQNSNINKIHLLLSTQACYAYALGKNLVLMQNRVPQIISYHYIAPSYNVGIVVNGVAEGKIIKA